MRTSRLRRLCSRARRGSPARGPGRVHGAARDGISRSPRRYAPVSDSGAASTSSSVPSATTCPPCRPALGPRSITWSAARMVSSSCSTTSTVFPRSRSCRRVSSSCTLSRWCRPMEGSSRMYSTPPAVGDLRARRMRCASPPERVSAERPRVRYCRPTLSRKRNRSVTSLRIGPAMSTGMPG